MFLVRFLGSIAIVASLLTVNHSAYGQDLPPDLIALFAELGITVEGNGQPVSPPEPVLPPEPAPPLPDVTTPEGLADLLGIPVEDLFPATPPTPISPPVASPEPPSTQPPLPLEPHEEGEAPPELLELADQLGIPIEDLFPTTPPTPILPPVASPQPPSTQPPSTLEPLEEGEIPAELLELAEVLGLPVEVFLGEAPLEPIVPNEPIVREPTADSLEVLRTALGDELFEELVGSTEPIVASPSASIAAVPEPTSALLAAVSAATLLGRLRRRGKVSQRASARAEST